MVSLTAVRSARIANLYPQLGYTSYCQKWQLPTTGCARAGRSGANRRHGSCRVHLCLWIKFAATPRLASDFGGLRRPVDGSTPRCRVTVETFVSGGQIAVKPEELLLACWHYDYMSFHNSHSASCYRAFALRVLKAARMIRRTLARFSGRCVQCSRLPRCLPGARWPSLRASRVLMTLLIACLSVRSSARMFDSFIVSLLIVKKWDRFLVQQRPVEYIALKQ